MRVVDDLSTGRRDNLEGLELGVPGSGAPVELHPGDVQDGDLLGRAMEGARGAFHEAAQVSVPASVAGPVRSYQVNVMGTLSVLEAARKNGAKVVFAASSAAYGDDPSLPKVETQPPRPLSPYASGKLAGEAMLGAWAHSYGLETVSLRYFNVDGARQADNSPYSGVIALFARAVLSGQAPTIFGSGEQTRDFIYVEDVVRANLLAMDRRLPPGIVLNVGTGKRVSIRQLYTILSEHAGVRGAPLSGPERTGDVLHSVASIERAKELLGFEPEVGLVEGLARTLAWYRARI